MKTEPPIVKPLSEIGVSAKGLTAAQRWYEEYSDAPDLILLTGIIQAYLCEMHQGHTTPDTDDALCDALAYVNFVAHASPELHRLALGAESRLQSIAGRNEGDSPVMGDTSNRKTEDHSVDSATVNTTSPANTSEIRVAAAPPAPTSYASPVLQEMHLAMEAREIRVISEGEMSDIDPVGDAYAKGYADGCKTKAIATEPVSLSHCSENAYDAMIPHHHDGYLSMSKAAAKAVLDASGVKYVD